MAAVAVRRPLVRVRGVSNRDYRGTNTRFHLADHHLDLDKLKLPESRLNLDTAMCELFALVSNTIKASTPPKNFRGSG